MERVAGSRRPKMVSCLGFSKIGSAPSISIRRIVPSLKISVPTDFRISSWAGVTLDDLSVKFLVFSGESPIRLVTQFSQNTTQTRLRYEQFDQICIKDP